MIPNLKQTYKKEGVTSLLSSIPKKIYEEGRARYYNFKGSNFHYQFQKQEGFEVRWQMIQPHLESHSSVLDIGCNAALFTERASENRFAVGIEQNSETVKSAIKYHGGSPEFGIVNQEITEESVSSLPIFDYTFVFSVYHHIYRTSGQESAEKILNSLVKKTSETLFFEPASRKSLYGDESLPFEDNNLKSVREYNEDMLMTVIDQDIDLEYIGSRTEGTKNFRCLFAIHI